MKSKEIVKNILNDIKVELSDEFDRNFSRGAFFDKKWPAKKDGSASHLIKTGKLRRSIRATLGTDFVRFTSSEQYAGIHNEGGDITVTFLSPINFRILKTQKRINLKGLSNRFFFTHTNANEAY